MHPCLLSDAHALLTSLLCRATAVNLKPPPRGCRAEKGWYNAGYIFPEGFHSRTLFRSRWAGGAPPAWRPCMGVNYRNRWLCAVRCQINELWGTQGHRYPPPTPLANPKATHPAPPASEPQRHPPHPPLPAAWPSTSCACTSATSSARGGSSGRSPPSRWGGQPRGGRGAQGAGLQAGPWSCCAHRQVLPGAAPALCLPLAPVPQAKHQPPHNLCTTPCLVSKIVPLPPPPPGRWWRWTDPMSRSSPRAAPAAGRG